VVNPTVRQQVVARRRLAVAHQHSGHLRTAIRHLEMSLALLAHQARRDLGLRDVLELQWEAALSRLLLVSLYAKIERRQAERNSASSASRSRP
jgi:hypothetical protein